jgi:hypothetical protein
MTDQPHRAFWLKKLEDSKLYVAYPSYKKDGLHVIEYAAFEEWKNRAFSYWSELEAIKKGKSGE